MSIQPTVRNVDRLAWNIAISTWVIGDLITTAIGFSLGATEAHPLSAQLMSSFGPWILIPFQLVALFVFWMIWWFLREHDIIARVGIPIGISITGTVIVINNLVVIAVLV